MKKFLLAVLLALSIFTANAETLYFHEDAHVRLQLTDQPCSTYVAETYLLPEVRQHFKSFVFEPRSEEMRALAGGKDKVDGCWSDYEDFAPKGHIVYINEFGVSGYLPLDEFVDVKAPKGIRT